MKLILLSNKGQVGWELQRSLAPLGDLVVLGRDKVNFDAPATLFEHGWISTVAWRIKFQETRSR